MATYEDFTPNDTIDNFQTGDNTIDIIGYVVSTSNNLHTAATSKFKKCVVSNAAGRKVQVIAWNKQIKMIEKVKELKTIVHFGCLKCSSVKMKEYNGGNVDFELQIKENSTVDVFDKFEDDREITNAEVTTILDAYKKIGSMLKIEAIVKTVPAPYQNNDTNITIGSITDGFYQLEVKLSFDCSTFKVEKGASVEVIGFMEQYPPGPPVLKVECQEQFKILERERVPFLEVIKGYRTKLIKEDVEK